MKFTIEDWRGSGNPFEDDIFAVEISENNENLDTPANLVYEIDDHSALAAQFKVAQYLRDAGLKAMEEAWLLMDAEVVRMHEERANGV